MWNWRAKAARLSSARGKKAGKILSSDRVVLRMSMRSFKQVTQLHLNPFTDFCTSDSFQSTCQSRGSASSQTAPAFPASDPLPDIQ